MLRAVNRVSERDYSLVREGVVWTTASVCPSAGRDYAQTTIRFGAHLSLLHRLRFDSAAADREVVLEMTGDLLEISQAVVALALSPGLVGFIRWWKARLQWLRGPAPWLDYYDPRKFSRMYIL